MRLKVLTLWQGKVAIRGKYIGQALKTGEAIVITHDNAEMTLTAREIYSRRVSISTSPMPDKYNNDADFLHYYKWEPDSGQERLI